MGKRPSGEKNRGEKTAWKRPAGKVPVTFNFTLQIDVMTNVDKYVDKLIFICVYFYDFLFRASLIVGILATQTAQVINNN